MTSAGLTPDEMQRWVQWKAATENIWEQVVVEITSATGLSAADFSVLTRIVELGAGALRQQVLADELGWQRARLSRQVSRMVDRGLVARTTVAAVVTVAATDDGRRAATLARRAHARAVRRSLLATAPPGSTRSFWKTVERLGQPSPTPDRG